MFRVTVFAIVLTFAATPQATLLCTLWCQPSDAATRECRHHELAASSIVKGLDNCGDATLNVRNFIREDGPRVAGADAEHALPVSRYWLTQPGNEARIQGNSERGRALDRRPLDMTLRL